jgi:hypothetical protein
MSVAQDLYAQPLGTKFDSRSLYVPQGGRKTSASSRRTQETMQRSHGSHLDKPLPRIRRTPPPQVSPNEPFARGFAKYNNQGIEFGLYRKERLENSE